MSLTCFSAFGRSFQKVYLPYQKDYTTERGGMKMDIAQVLKIVQPFGATLLLGEKGITRPVKTVEVLEVPQLEDWVAKDLLLISTFYSIKDNEQAQVDLLKVLIDNNAAGLMIKLGRFIDRLPDSVWQLAHDNNFPIISLPKDVPYIDILTPIYQQLNLSLDHVLLQEMKQKSYDTVEQILNEIFETYEIKTYIENIYGELMYSGHYLIKDPWRQSKSLFSSPSYTDATPMLNKWVQKFTEDNAIEYIEMRPLKRMIVPLYTKGELYGLFHFVYRSEQQRDLLTDRFIAKKINLVHVTLMSELIGLQKKQLDEGKELTNLKEYGLDMNYKVLLHIKVPFVIFEMKENPLVDYALLILKHLHQLTASIKKLTKSIMFVRNKQFYMLLIFTPKRITDTVYLRTFLEKRLIETAISHYLISISTPFVRISELEEKLLSVTRVTEIGLHLYPGAKVYSYNKLGIYELLLKLSSDQHVIDYVDSILRPLEEVDDALIETLKMYLSVNGNASKTAENLYVNRRTVSNRLKRIRDICNLDLDDAEVVFILQFCIRIRELY